MKSQRLFQKIRIGKTLGLAVALLLGSHPATGQRAGTELGSNRSIEREMGSKGTHLYKLSLKKNEFFQVKVEQKGIDVTLKLLDASGDVLATMDSPNGKEGPETLSYIATKMGSFVLEISRFDEQAENGRYTIRRGVSRIATSLDKRQVEVERLFVGAMLFVKKIKPQDPEGQLGIAIEKLSGAESGWRELKDEYMANLTEKLIQGLKEAKNRLDALQLPVGGTIDRQLKVREVHTYRIRLKQGQVLSVMAQEKDIDIQIVLLRMPEKHPITYTDFGAGNGRETLTAVIQQSGSYDVVVGSLAATSDGNYQLTSQIKEAKTPADEQRIEAERLLAEAIKNIRTRKSEGAQSAAAKLERGEILGRICR